MRAVLTWFPSLLEAGTRLGLGASHFHFLKEIPAGTEYEIRWVDDLLKRTTEVARVF